MCQLNIEIEAKQVLMEEMPTGWSLSDLMGKLPLSLEQAEAVQTGDISVFTLEQLRECLDLLGWLKDAEYSVTFRAEGKHANSVEALHRLIRRHKRRMRVIRYAFGGES